ncbi:MAG: site-specific integrase [Bacteriovoracaceae bacterium]|nr:site-specific integrase [Bacteriovoracaceae bacterium]
MSENKKRYETITYKNVKGIRRDSSSGKFRVEKYIRGERFSATFSNVREAADWKKNFHPSLSLKRIDNSKIKNKAKEKLKEIEVKKRNSIKVINGNDLGYTFSDVWELYKIKHLSKIEKSSRDKRLADASSFYKGLMDVKMIHFNADLISTHLELKKEIALLNPKSRRFNFDNDLKSLKALLNWYREKYDDQFSNPILKRHREEGIIRKIPNKKKKLKKHELLAFFDALESDSLFWRDFAETQFYLASRVQEVAGLLLSSVDFISKTLDIENVMVWGVDKKFSYLKDSPKNSEDREASINGKLFEIMQRRKIERFQGSFKVCPVTGVSLDLVFHIEGKPLSYRQIQYHYNKALKKAGLSHKFSSTHIMRHTMANMVRSKLGLDSAQAVGGWKDRSLVENVYTETPSHIGLEAREKIENFLYDNANETPPRNPAQNRGKLLRLVN